jgi:CheY-like chemotaxis protein
MSKRILVVEDQPDNRQIIRDMLPLLATRLPRLRTAKGRSQRLRNSDLI